MKILNILGIILLFAILTILSQVGGIILLLWLLLYQFFKKRLKNAWVQRGVHVGGFVVFYLFFMFIIIPPLARIQDRVPLPMSKSGALVPVTYWTAIFGRNYIKSEGRDKLETIAEAFVKKHPELKVKYMDCNYPFRFIGSDEIHKNTGFPILEGLFPHFTHLGDKADIALIYNDEEGNPSNLTPTAIGYGSSVEPNKDEPGYVGPNCPCRTKTLNQKKGKDGVPCVCDNTLTLGFIRMYSFMYRNVPQNENIKLDTLNSASLIKMFTPYDSGIILEAHLRKRLKVLQTSFGNHSCKTVRHDDHFHVRMGGIK
jgi:hypothetical protein